MPQSSDSNGRPLKLLVLASADVIHTRRWVEYFRSRGHEVRLATLEPSPNRALDERVLPTRFLRINALRYPLAAPAVRRLVHNFAPDLVNAHYVPGYGFMAALARLASPLVVSCWGSDVLVNAGRSAFHRARARLVIRRATLLTCDASVLGESIVGLGALPERVLEVPMGIDRELFHPDGVRDPSPSGCRYEGAAPFRIISTRRLEPVYSVETLLRASLILREAGWNFKLLVLGDGSERRRLETFAGFYSGVNRLAEFRGWVAPQELAGELCASDIYVSTSRSDGTSVSLLEAMACGAFPVLCDIPGNREWVEDGFNGLLFPPGDFAALSACLIRAMTDHRLRERARERNLDLVERRALWERNMLLVEERFRELVSAQAGELSRGRQNGQKPVVRS